MFSERQKDKGIGVAVPILLEGTDIRRRDENLNQSVSYIYKMSGNAEDIATLNFTFEMMHINTNEKMLIKTTTPKTNVESLDFKMLETFI